MILLQVAVALKDRFHADFRDPNVCITGIDSEEHGDVSDTLIIRRCAPYHFVFEHNIYSVKHI